jgi:hypothetical protein
MILLRLILSDNHTHADFNQNQRTKFGRCYAHEEKGRAPDCTQRNKIDDIADFHDE